MTRLHYNYLEIMNVVARLRDLGDTVLELTMGLPGGEWKVQSDSMHDLYIAAAKLEVAARRTYAADIHGGWLLHAAAGLGDVPEVAPLSLELPPRAQACVPTGWIPAVERARRLDWVAAEVTALARRLDSGGIAEPHLGPAAAGELMAIQRVIGADAVRMFRCAAALDAGGQLGPSAPSSQLAQ
ncbi:hypothetical protein [Mycobacteroides abscessus]|uniref:hypothetical protein n=1 Tax=Mycobacteroides abscessus TaxID=36809 RepID=UPI000927C30A|nr:hypothetical protein [Mycobacteroides abscessus]SIA48755.1 Uncharacterised protein [Mycobacteroides abscessus subsp. abscessus]SIA70191.1 Uncharacterised protein [Mycobacteroides abscessus subsp. abscessus]SKQ72623.1 Uncharacterised protein [Mycobacteroides abscessus subsp. massiliense]SLF01031.1 Uncharacterised protein [Mycobacteroides abscessus subsp. massiliense]